MDIKRNRPSPDEETPRRLTRAGIELLQAIMAVGGDAQMLAQHLGISRSAIYNRARRLRDLLDTNSLLNTVVFAVNNGLVKTIPGNPPPRQASKQRASGQKIDRRNRKNSANFVYRTSPLCRILFSAAHRMCAV